jgi:hypothetical protein
MFKQNRKSIRSVNVCIALLAIAVVSGCSGEPQEGPAISVAIKGNIAVPAGTDSRGRVEVHLYQTWFGEGELRHPLKFIESFETTVGEFSHSFGYPDNNGEGLIVYAWIDSDGDGINCTPTERNDLAGLTEVTDFSLDSGEEYAAAPVTVQLQVDCAGPDWFYPGPGPVPR